MSSPLPQLVNTFGQDLKRRYGERVHKLAIHAGFACPNRDGSLGRGGCTFCNNASFSPNAHQDPEIATQIAAGRRVIDAIAHTLQRRGSQQGSALRTLSSTKAHVMAGVATETSSGC